MPLDPDPDPDPEPEELLLNDSCPEDDDDDDDDESELPWNDRMMESLRMPKTASLCKMFSIRQILMKVLTS